MRTILVAHNTRSLFGKLIKSHDEASSLYCLIKKQNHFSMNDNQTSPSSNKKFVFSCDKK